MYFWLNILVNMLIVTNFCPTIAAVHAKEPAEAVSTTAGILSAEAGKQQKGIRARLGPKVAEVSSTTGSPTVSSNKQG